MLTVLHAFLVQALGRLKFEHFFGQQPAEDLATNKYCELKLEDLTHLGTLGAGGFGQRDLLGKELSGQILKKTASPPPPAPPWYSQSKRAPWKQDRVAS